MVRTRFGSLFLLLQAALYPQTAIVRTMAYHQITALPDDRTSIVLSGNGETIAFARPAKPIQIFAMNFDGSGQRQVDSYTPECAGGAIVDISDDGAKIVSTEGRQIRIADAQGARQLFQADTGVNALKISGDGRKVFFLLDQRGLYVVDADGAGLRQIVGTGVTAVYHSLGVTRDGTRIVFGLRKSANIGPDAIFGIDLDGSGLHMIVGPAPYVRQAGISADGSKAFFDTVDQLGVVNFDGSEARLLPDAGAGLQMSADGSVLLAGDMLYGADGIGALQISTTFNMLTLGRPAMNATATRFVYALGSQIATMEIDPADLGSAPSILDAAFSPIYVIPAESFRGHVTARVGTSDRVLGVSYAIVRAGRVEHPVNDDVFLEEAAGGVFRSQNVRAGSGSLPGPRMLRLFAQTVDAAGKRHATLVDIAPFSVLLQPPPQ
jgi:hypothetical protein